MSCEPNLATYLSASLVPIIAILGLYIAYRQYRLAQNKLRFELYQKRFAIYESTLEFHQKIINSNIATIQSEAFNLVQNKFIKSMRESQFLFESSSGVFQLLNELHTKSFKITGFRMNEQEFAEYSDLFIKMQKEMFDSIEFFDKSIYSIETMMAPYLDFKKITV